MKQRSPYLYAMLCMLACVTGSASAEDYVPDAPVLQRLTLQKARNTLAEEFGTGKSVYVVLGWKANFVGWATIKSIRITASKIQISASDVVNDKPATLTLDLLNIGAISENESFLSAPGIQFTDRNGKELAKFLIGINSSERARAIADAIYVLKQNAEGSPAEEQKFAEIVRAYLAADPKPQITEEVRRLRVQGRAAVNEGKFAEAVELLGDAVRVAPWWPTGHFNYALALAETGSYREAVLEMKRYLMLAPNAPDARAMQDRIYEWERMAAKAGS